MTSTPLPASSQQTKTDVLPTSAFLSSAMEIGRSKAIQKQIRCIECGTSETIESANSAFAIKVRKLIREGVRRGDSDEEIKSVIVKQYGAATLLTDPLARDVLPLWGIAGITTVSMTVLGWRLIRSAFKKR